MQIMHTNLKLQLVMKIICDGSNGTEAKKFCLFVSVDVLHSTRGTKQGSAKGWDHKYLNSSFEQRRKSFDKYLFKISGEYLINFISTNNSESNNVQISPYLIYKY